MNIEAKKSGINFDEAIVGCGSQVLAETDIILPPQYPDILRILEIDTSVHIKEKEIGGDKVILRGEIVLTTIYVPDPQMSDCPAHSIITTVGFTDVCRAQGVSAEMKINQVANVTSVDYNLINSRKLSVKANVHTEIKAIHRGVTEFISDAQGDIPVETLKSQVKSYCRQLDEDYEITVSDRLDIPGSKPLAAEILKITPLVKEYDAKLLSDKCVLKGICNVSTLYVSRNDMQLQFMEHEIPFTEVLDAPGASEDMDADIDFNIFSTYYETDESDEGITALGVELKMSASLCISGEQSTTVLSDCYSPECDINISRKLLKVDRIEKTAKAQLSIKGDISLPEDLPPIARICSISSNPCVDSVLQDDNFITLEGTLKISVLYLTADADYPICIFNSSVPFSHNVNVDTCTDFMVDCHIHPESLSFTLPDDKTLSIRAAAVASVKIICSDNISVIDEITVSECEKERKSAIVIYFVQPEDTLWTVAKKYKTTIDKIINTNSLTPSHTLTVGTKLVIPTV